MVNQDNAGPVLVKDPPLWQVSGSLRGLAILCVVVSHAAFYGVMRPRLWRGEVVIYTAMFRIPWQSVMPAWVISQELIRMGVPLFLVISGQFVASFPQTWRSILKFVEKLIWPFLFWSLFGWAYDWLVFPPGWNVLEFLQRLPLGDAQVGYFYIPLIIQFYLLAGPTVRWVKRSPAAALLVSAVIQLAYLGVNYLGAASSRGLIDLRMPIAALPECLFPRFAFFFVLGIWIGSFPSRANELMKRHLLLFGGAALVTAILMIAEHGLIFHLITGSSVSTSLTDVWLALAPWKISTSLWAASSVLFLYCLGKRGLFGAKWLQKIGSSAFVIYLLNGAVVLPMAHVLSKITAESRFHWATFVVLGAWSALAPLGIASVIRKRLRFARFVLGDGIKQ
jgi:membrane-bound acyltransferase YfiQ involved in biofilm formation